MFDPSQMLLLIGVLMVLVLSGIHLAIALLSTATLGLYLMQGDLGVASTFISNSAYEVIRDYVFAVIPLFILMGEFLAKCGAAGDLFTVVNRATKWIPGRLAVATVFANAIFAFITGVSIAAAAAFSRIAWPEMKRYGYERKFGLGCIAGSACLGMLIPPSVLMIVWGVITETSIGTLFIAGIIPGFIVVGFFTLYILFVAITQPHRVGEARRAVSPVGAAPVDMQPVDDTPIDNRSFFALALSVVLVLALVLGILAGIWLGVFTPTEGAGVGCVLSLLLAISKGVRLKEIFQVILSVGRTLAPLLLLLISAQIYSRVLSMTGVTGAAKALFIGSGLDPWQVFVLMVVVWLILGCLIDSISIILLTVPVFHPVAVALGFDPIAFAIMGIIAIEVGFMTPPFGLIVFTIKAALPDESVTTGEIFAGTMPYWFGLLATIIVIFFFPPAATYLTTLGR
jgi:tripartite ATP-independent transporter DctM subunit